LQRAVRISRRCKRFTNYNWAPKSAAVYTARLTFSLFDICIGLFQSPNLKYVYNVYSKKNYVNKIANNVLRV